MQEEFVAASDALRYWRTSSARKPYDYDQDWYSCWHDITKYHSPEEDAAIPNHIINI